MPFTCFFTKNMRQLYKVVMNSNQVRESNNHAQAMLNGVRGSYRKINIILDAVRGKSAQDAVTALDFIPKKHSPYVSKLIRSAMSNAKAKGVKGDLYIQHIYATKAHVLKRLFFKGRGRTGINQKPYSHITVVLTNERKK